MTSSLLRTPTDLVSGLDHYDHVVIDTPNTAYAWTLHVDHRIVVTRACYLALRRGPFTQTPTAVVLINEPGRALNTNDVEHVIGQPITATIPHDPTIALAVDSGLVDTRLPRALTRAIGPLGAMVAGS